MLHSSTIVMLIKGGMKVTEEQVGSAEGEHAVCHQASMSQFLAIQCIQSSLITKMHTWSWLAIAQVIRDIFFPSQAAHMSGHHI
jgi:hypothetical protein